MKIIFLDIDGVLNSEQFAERHYNDTGKALFCENFIDPDSVYRMTKWFENHNDCKIVLDSSWRYSTYKQTVEKLKNTGLKPLIKYIVGVTERSRDGFRGAEVRDFIKTIGDDKYKHLWKDEKPFSIDRWVIVDDDNDMFDEQLPFFVKTSFESGITNEDYNKIESILYNEN